MCTHRDKFVRKSTFKFGVSDDLPNLFRDPRVVLEWVVEIIGTVLADVLDVVQDAPLRAHQSDQDC